MPTAAAVTVACPRCGRTFRARLDPGQPPPACWRCGTAAARRIGPSGAAMGVWAAALWTLAALGVAAAWAGGLRPPAIALVVAAGVLGFSPAALVAYGWDKLSARRDGRRTPERLLHTIELLGGWPGALLAQRLFRHKSSKDDYRRAFRLLAGLNVAGSLALVAVGWWLGC